MVNYLNIIFENKYFQAKNRHYQTLSHDFMLSITRCFHVKDVVLKLNCLMVFDLFQCKLGRHPIHTRFYFHLFFFSDFDRHY